MPTFEITSPDGKTYEVTGPEGSTKEQALEKVKAQHAGQPPADSRSTLADVAIEGGKGLLRGAASFAGDLGEAVMGPFGPSKHFANLKADIVGGERPTPDPSYGSQISHAAGIDPAPQTTPGKFASTTGEVVGNAASYLGPGSALVKGGAAVLSGIGSEAAGEAVEGFHSPALEAGARMVGGLAGAGGATAAAERNLTKLAEQLPTPKNIYDAANAGYDMLKKSNTRISPQGTQDLLATVKNDLHADNFRDYLAPATYRAIEELGSTGSATIGDLDGVRKLLNRVPGTNPTDREAARRAIQAIDDYLINVPVQHVISGDPARDAAILKHAQGNWALHKQ